MGSVTGIQFQKNGKIYYFDSNGIESRAGDYVIADTVRGQDLGEVVMPPREISEENWNGQMKKLVRIADEQDIQHGRENRIKEKEAFSICQKKIAEHKLEMKLVSVEYAFDNSKILFFFTANGRVDFRSLVKDLASVFKMRIELRQIGVRDEAKMLGGLGPCGRQICCGSFLEQFQPVSIKMAKEQNLSLNPTKISGVCGRLMCCLKYEQDHYEQARKRMPKVGKEVSTPDGTGPVTELNIVKETVFVRLVNGDTSEIKEYPLESITRLTDEHSIPDSGNRNHVSRTEESAVKQKTIKKEELRIEKSNQEQDGATEEQEQNQGKHKTRNNKSRRGNLGQPVKRENPNRTAPPAAGAETAEAGQHETTSNNGRPTDGGSRCAVQKESKSGSQENRKGNRSAWADAVQKAMQAIDMEK